MCFGDDRQTSPSTVIQTQTLPEHITAASKENIGLAKQIAARPYVQYNGQRIAEFNPDQVASFNKVRSNVGAGQQDLDAASAMLAEAAGVDFNGVANTYINPYLDATLRPTIDNITAARDSSLARLGRQAASRGTGGTGNGRLRTMQGDIIKAGNKQVSDATASLMAQGFETGRTQFNADQARKMTAANQRAGLAEQKQKQGLTDAQALSEIGAQQQGKTQANLDLAFQDFLRQWNYPVENLNLLLSAVSNTPAPVSSTQTGQTYTPSTFGQTLGGAGAAAAGAAMLAKSFMGS